MVTTRGTNARFTSSSRHQDPKSPVNKFYKVVLPSTMKKHMMRIPPRFVREQGSNLPEVITLETPVGFKRRIKLKKIDEEIWLHDGWSKFIEAHSIKEGHFLFFKYDGSTSFRVHIFNMSASEIDYPLDLDVVDISDSDDDLIEITEEEFFGTQSTSEDDGGDTEQNIPKKTPRDIEFDEIIHDVDEIYKEEEKEEGRVCSG